MSIFNRIYSRAAWGARYRAGFGDRRRNYPLREVYLHHSVTAHLSANATVAQEMAQMRVLENIGQSRFGGGISYTFVVFPSGRIYMGTGASRIGAHTGGRNSVALAFCIAGNYTSTGMTNAQMNTIAQALRDFQRSGIIARARLNGGHRDAPGASTACPGNAAYRQIGTINSRAASGNASGGGSSASTPASRPSAPAAPAVSNRITWTYAKSSRNGTLRIYRQANRSDQVGTVPKGEPVLLDTSRQTDNWVGVGANWWVRKSDIERASHAAKDGLVIGQWPGRPLPLRDTHNWESHWAWVDTLGRARYRDSRLAVAMQKWLNAGGERLVVDGKIGPRTVSALQRRLNRNGASLRVDGQRGRLTIRAEITFLNRRHRFTSYWPQTARASRR